MNNRYRLTFSTKKVYKEIELLPDMEQVKVGTTRSCDVRLNKDMFFSEFEVYLENHKGNWRMSCDDNVYIASSGVMMLFTKELTHGDEFQLKYRSSKQDMCNISFMLEYSVTQSEFDRVIDIRQLNQVTIGADARCNICLADPMMANDIVVLQRQNDRLYVVDQNTTYGVFVNEIKVTGNKELHDYDFFTVLGYSFYYKHGFLYTANANDVQINHVPSTLAVRQSSHMVYPKFNRNTRIQYKIPEDKIKILPPEKKPERKPKNIILSLIPMLAMIALTVVLRGIMSGGGSYVIYMVAMTGIGAIMSVVTYLYDGRQQKKDNKLREKKYLEYIDKKEQEIEEKRLEETEIRKKVYVSLPEDIHEIFSFGPHLFEKGKPDVDFLQIYIGTGMLKASCEVTYDEQEFISVDDDLVGYPEQIEEKHRYLDRVPITVDLKESGGVGIVGVEHQLLSFMKNMTLDLATRHFYNDVQMLFIMTPESAAKYAWLRCFPHVQNKMYHVYNIICDEESRKIHMEILYAELSHRQEVSKGKQLDSAYTHYVIMVLDSKGFHKHPVSKFVDGCEKLGFTFVFFEQYEEMLPEGCRYIIRLNEQANEGELVDSQDGKETQAFYYEVVKDHIMEQAAMKLFSVYVDDVSLESELTKSITLFQLMGIIAPEDLDLGQRWASSEVYKSMAAPLGVKVKNEVVSLDISDKATAHGPHGLVAGTTGSGKSEILQSYVLSMASLFHPYDVGFMIIDFKGGGMANQFKNLPHLIGTITNIDGREVNRSLLFIKAELIRRQELFSQNDVNHINDYIKLYKSGKVSDPLPHLIMIVDEFAELKAEFPDFMKEIISAARIGRTLGVHLILATQKPSGVVDNQIWSNSKFKLCLKVQTREDSMEVLKKPLAAEIVEPGRAYFQVGNNEIFELFQSAYSGAKVSNLTGEEQKEFEINCLNTWGKRQTIYSNKKQMNEENAKNQLEYIVDYIDEYCQEKKIVPLPGICLPPLPDSIYLSDMKDIRKGTMDSVSVPIGIFDDPSQQRQEELLLNLSESNTIIIGSSQTGKTNLLQTIVFSAMLMYTPAEVNFYVIDGGNMAMKVFEDVNHVGGVALVAEEEKVINLFKMLNNIVKERKAVFAKNGLGTYQSYIEAGFHDMPAIFVMIDNIAVFREFYQNLEDNLLQLTREGISVGISFITTATQTSAMGYRSLANYGRRIAYTCNDKGEFMNLFGRCKIEPKETPGRGLIVIDKRVLEFQTARPIEAEKEIERVEKIRQYIAEIQNKYPNQHAKLIPVVPDVVYQSQLMREKERFYAQPYLLPVGISYDTVTLEYVDLAAVGALAVMGRENSGKTNMVRQMMYALSQNLDKAPVEAYVLDGVNRQLAFTKDYEFVKQYSLNAQDGEALINQLCETLENRREETVTSSSPDEVLAGMPLLLLIIENAALMQQLASDKNLALQLVKVFKQLKNMKACVVFSGLENAQVGFSSGEVLKAVKENKNAFIFEDMQDIRFHDTTLKLVKQYPGPLKQGDMFYLAGNTYKKIRTVFYDIG